MRELELARRIAENGPRSRRILAFREQRKPKLTGR